MHRPFDQQFQEERLRFQLRCGCEDCVYFDPAENRCAHGYPNEWHRTQAFESRNGSETYGVFCKEFELA